jgi:hypothetical protein
MLRCDYQQRSKQMTKYNFFSNEQALEFAFQINSRAEAARTYKKALAMPNLTEDEKEFLARSVATLKAQIKAIKAEWFP